MKWIPKENLLCYLTFTNMYWIGFGWYWALSIPLGIVTAEVLIYIGMKFVERKHTMIDLMIARYDEYVEWNPNEPDIMFIGAKEYRELVEQLSVLTKRFHGGRKIDLLTQFKNCRVVVLEENGILAFGEVAKMSTRYDPEPDSYENPIPASFLPFIKQMSCLVIVTPTDTLLEFYQIGDLGTRQSLQMLSTKSELPPEIFHKESRAWRAYVTQQTEEVEFNA